MVLGTRGRVAPRRAGGRPRGGTCRQALVCWTMHESVVAPVCPVKHEPGHPLRARAEGRVWESEEEKRVRNCLGVGDKPTGETQAVGHGRVTV